jgi:hypothetical protein
MKIFRPLNNLVVRRNLWLILLSEIRLFLNLLKPTSKNIYNSKDSNNVLIFYLALVAVELLVIL